MELSNGEKKVLLSLKEIGGSALINEIVKENNLIKVMNASSWLKIKGLVEIEEDINKLVSLDKEGKKYSETGLPEKTILNVLKSGKTAMAEVSPSLPKEEFTLALGHLRALGAKIEKGNIVVDDINTIEKEILKREEFLKFLSEQKDESELDKNLLNHFLKRKNILIIKERVTKKISLTEQGKEVLKTDLVIKEEVSQLTPELITSGDWKNVELKRYDTNLFAPRVYGGKEHPLVQLTNEIRNIFLHMGFEEMEGNYVQSCFWNMDALFIPQDHPARDLQDTFYLKNPEKLDIEEKEYIDTVKRVHEDGLDISKGWKYDWDIEEGKKAILRTHTTVDTIRHLWNNRETVGDSVKVFSIGRVFRKENIDSTHLPEFTQIEGIIMEEKASFQMLVGMLKEFYERMGFEEIRIRPAYFPYTEPSLEVEIKFKGKWLEMGGAGVFRPEVTEPMGIKYPVLAWGLGLERLAMLIFELDDIRDLYISDIDWLKEFPLL